MYFNYKSNSVQLRKSGNTANFKKKNICLKFCYSGIITINIDIN